MIFTFGTILFLIGYLWYEGTEFDRDWRDWAKLGFISVGLLLVTFSILSLAWVYLP